MDKRRFRKGDLVSWLSGKKRLYGRIVAIKGSSVRISLHVEKRWGEEIEVVRNILQYEPPVTLSVSDLRKFCRFEIRYAELKQGRPFADIAIPETYQIVPEDLKEAVLNFHKYGMEEEEFGKEYFWNLRNEIYDGVEIDSALTGLDHGDNEISAVPDRYTVFSNAWEVFLQKFVYKADNINLDDVITEVQTWEDNKDKPLSEREFTHAQKKDFLDFWHDDRLVSADEETKAAYRKILDSLCAENDLKALKKKAYACYGHGNAAYGQNWPESLACLLKLMELDPNPETANTLGYMFYYGRCTDGIPEYDKAFYYFSIGTAGWYYESRYKLADMFWHGYGVAKNPKASASLIWELYRDQVKKIGNGQFGCNFADVALRAGNIYKEGIDCSPDADTAFSYYLQARYAIKMRMLSEDNFGDQKVAAGIEQAIADILPETSYAKPKSTVHYSSMYFLLQNGLHRKHVMEMRVRRLSETDARLTFRIVPYANEKYPPKLFLTVPPAHFSGLLEQLTVTARHIETLEVPQDTDVIRFDDVDWYSFYLYGKKVAEIDADFVFTVPGRKGKKHSFVSVTFIPGGARYDYLTEIMLQPGNKVIVKTPDGETEATVTAAFEKAESELALPLKRYKKIIRKVE